MAASHFFLIGPGAVGKVLARRLVKAGWTCEGVCGRGTAAGKRLAKELNAPYSTSLQQIKLKNGLILLSVGTWQTAPLAQELAALDLDWGKISVLHNNGMLDAAPLLPLAKRGAGVAACHPFMTFPRFGEDIKAGSKEDRYDPRFPLIFGIDGNPRGEKAAKELAKACKGITLEVKGKDRVAYHAAAVQSCTLMGATVIMAKGILEKVGISEKSAEQAVMSIAQETLSNFSEYGIGRSWTGPAVRGDKQTVAAHTKAIGKLNPESAKVYKLLSEWVMKQKV